ncbi:Capsule polysaccharide export protein, partial [hydrothermal vent metagenome]
ETRVTPLQEIQVDGTGFIFIPYAGRIRAAGNSPEALRRIITRKLEDQTPEPQVEVRRLAGNGSTVSLIGSIAAQGVYPIERPTRTLSAMISSAGGLTIEPEIAQITVIRGKHSSKIWFQDMFRNPQYDIALRGGDRILVEQDTRSYTALGATSGQSRVQFRTQTLSAIEALATVGGLRSATADPTGIFVMRDESAEVANLVLERDDITTPRRMVYVLNLTQTNGMFIARDFTIRDNDTVYVTEAPFTQWSKAISALTGTLGALGSVSTANNTLSTLSGN